VPVKPLAGLSRSLRGLLIASVAVSVAGIVSDLYGHAQYSSLPEGAEYSEVFLPSDTLIGLVALAQLGILVAVAVLFLVWVHRINKNLHALSGTAMQFTPGWSVGWFFIPFMNLFKPYQAVKEIWLVSHRSRQPLLLGEKTAAGQAGLVGWWWFSFLLSSFVGRLAWSLGSDVSDVSSYLSALVADAVANGVDAAGYGVTLLLVSRIAAAYAANIDESRALPGGTAVTGGRPAFVVAQSTGAVAAGGTGAATSAPASSPAELPPAAWHPDPAGRHQLRWWNGAEWTEWVGDGGVMSEDPL
jgi:hypothetical protein